MPNGTIDACAPGGAAPFAIEWTYGDRTKFAVGDVLVLQLRNRLSGFPVRVDSVPTTPTPLMYPATSASVRFPHPIPMSWGFGKLVQQPLLWLQKANNANVNSQPVFSAGSVIVVCSCTAGDEDCACAPTCGAGLACVEKKACVRLGKTCTLTSECTARGTVARQCVGNRCVASSCPSVLGVEPGALGCTCSNDTLLRAAARCVEGTVCDVANGGANGGVCVLAPPATSTLAPTPPSTTPPTSSAAVAKCSYYKRFCPAGECAPDGPDNSWVCGPKRTCATLGCASWEFRCEPINGWELMGCVPIFSPTTSALPVAATRAPSVAHECAQIGVDIEVECTSELKLVSESYAELLMAAKLGVKSEATQTKCATLRATRLCFASVMVRHAACTMPWSSHVVADNNDLRSTLPTCNPQIAKLLAQIDCDICVAVPSAVGRLSLCGSVALVAAAVWFVCN